MRKEDDIIQSELMALIADYNGKIIVLDDDPTGVQTVHDVYVYTDWSIDNIRRGFREENKLFYILTNSRSFTKEQTTICHNEVITNVEIVAKEEDIDFIIISRSDSTLRGHYPLENEILKKGIEKNGGQVDGEIICPFFAEGGRFTIENIHYVKQEGRLIPAGETEFAKDKTFGYKSSNLLEYVEEKTAGKYKANSVISIATKDLKEKNIDKIYKQLMDVVNFNKIIVNSSSYEELTVFIVALYKAMKQGKRFLFRVAASFVKVIGGIADAPLLQKKDMVRNHLTNGGIIVVGSHTNKTTSQLEELRKLRNIEFIEFNSDLVLDEKLFEKEIKKVVKEEEEFIKKGINVVVYTKRKLLVVENDTKEEALIRSVKISKAVARLVKELVVTPSFVVAKGGITSSDIGVKSLRVKRALVLGQVEPGIPVWETDAESKFPGIPYIIFPGNVGEISTLKKVVEVLI